MNRNQRTIIVLKYGQSNPFVSSATFPGAEAPPAKRDRLAWRREYSKKRDSRKAERQSFYAGVYMVKYRKSYAI